MTDALFAEFGHAVRRCGHELDDQGFGGVQRCNTYGRRVSSIQTRSGNVPSLEIHLPGMVTIHKPTDWEVDGNGAVAEDVHHPPLSAFVQSIFPRDRFPIVWDPEQSYGFLHRLDIPSSGLVMGGTTYEGYLCLRLQLDTQRVQRDYMVLCRGLVSSILMNIAARVDVAPEPSQRKSISDYGKPSHTQVCVQTHVAGRSDMNEGSMCITDIRIFTGRRHQIRVHMRHSNHPTVGDARYACRETVVRSGDRGGLGFQRSEALRWTYNAFC